MPCRVCVCVCLKCFNFPRIDLQSKKSVEFPSLLLFIYRIFFFRSQMCLTCTQSPICNVRFDLFIYPSCRHDKRIPNTHNRTHKIIKSTLVLSERKKKLCAYRGCRKIDFFASEKSGFILLHWKKNYFIRRKKIRMILCQFWRLWSSDIMNDTIFHLFSQL